MSKFSLGLFCMAWLLVGCAGDPMFTKALRLDAGTSYAPSTRVEILESPPTQPYDKIALLETRMFPGAKYLDLLESMQRKATELGADAIVLIGFEEKPSQQQLIYNPWLRGYQTLGGDATPTLRGYAIRYKH